MTHDDVPAYGLWTLVILNSLVFIIFAFSFSKPRTPRDWRSFSAFSAFIVALFAEMYGFPLTIFLLSGWLQRRYPGLDLMSHDAGHLWSTIFGLQGNPHLSVLHILSNVVIAGGFILLGASCGCSTRHRPRDGSQPPELIVVSGIRNISASSPSCLASYCNGRPS